MTTERRNFVLEQTFPDVETDYDQRGAFSILAAKAGDRVAVAALAPEYAESELSRFTDEIGQHIDTGEIALPTVEGMDETEVRSELVIELFQAADRLAKDEVVAALVQRSERQGSELQELRELLASDEGALAREVIEARATAAAAVEENARLRIDIVAREDIIANRDIEKVRRQVLRAQITGHKAVQLVKSGISDFFKPLRAAADTQAYPYEK